MRHLPTLLFVFTVIWIYPQDADIHKTLFSIRINDSLIFSDDCNPVRIDDIQYFDLNTEVNASARTGIKNGQNVSYISINNNSKDTLRIENLVPFGEDAENFYITSTGPWALARAKLFIPGKGDIGVILPDNAWELGYGASRVDEESSIAMLARRTKINKGKKHRYKTYLYPGGTLNYDLYTVFYEGEWQNGLRKVFQDFKLFELDEFDDTLYKREDLQWIKDEYLIALQFAWDKDFFDWSRQEYTINQFLDEGKDIFGGYDVYGLWPTWPRLGVDERNQWNMFESLPGGLNAIKTFSQDMQDEGTSFFICYNPWDESTKKENPYNGMARLIEATDANGVVLDCHGWSQEKYQRSADSIKEGVIMYSEGMAVIKDMPGIISGRVHNAIFMSPELNLNKLIKPDFSIFRVLERKDPDWNREVCISFFNGYGIEINYFAPGRPEETTMDFPLLANTLRVLRENSSNFRSEQWTPLINTLKDSVWVNKWPGNEKIIYTIYSLIPEGFNGPLFEVEKENGYHFINLLDHEEISLQQINGKHYAKIELDAFNKSWLDSRKEGSPGCIARLLDIIDCSIEEKNMIVAAHNVDEIKVWCGNPTYQKDAGCKILVAGRHQLNIFQNFGHYQGKFVIQTFKDAELLDEKIVYLEEGGPELLAKKSVPPQGNIKNMKIIPGGKFYFSSKNTDHFIPYPINNTSIELNPYYMDIFPVSNAQYYEFILSTGYLPSDTSNYLKHWNADKYPEDLKDHPIVYVDIADAQAYANWAGKRLPTEAEWQYAAQGKDLLKWPWGNEYDSTKCNNASGMTSNIFTYPEGASPFGIQDMIGNVWQLTSDMYFDGSYYFVIMKGGSFYKPTSSWWYVQGGAQPSDRQQMLLLVNPGLNRNSTIGFRCVKDAE